MCAPGADSHAGLPLHHAGLHPELHERILYPSETTGFVTYCA